MKHIAFFITHTTLTEEHCDLTFRSIQNQSTAHKFNKLYIYNTHSHELSNDTIIKLYNAYTLSDFFLTVEVLPYDESSHKSLGQDITNIKNYCKSKYSSEDRILILKSDCLLSKNYFDVLFHLPPGPVYFTAPFICAKKRVENHEILEYVMRDTYIPSDAITFFVEDTQHSSINDFTNRKDVRITDQTIKFTSCYVINDFSCHVMSIQLLDHVIIQNQTWGGINLKNLLPYFIETDRCFVVHKYHNIISINRSTQREGPVEDWLLS